LQTDEYAAPDRMPASLFFQCFPLVQKRLRLSGVALIAW
jgi:hypothetical protein